MTLLSSFLFTTKITIFLNFYVLIITSYSYIDVNGAEVNDGSINHLLNVNENTEYVSDDYSALKEEISLPSDEADKFFQKVKKQLLKQIDRIKEKGNSIIPETTFQRIVSNGGHLSESIVRKVQKHGVLIVRNTIPPRETLLMRSELTRYMYNNDMFQSNASQAAFEIYWSKPQLKARQHPNMIQVQKALLQDVWHTDEDNEVDVDLRLNKK